MQHPSPRSIYNLDRLAASPSIPVIVCEGEKTADHAALIFPDAITTTSPAGAYAAAKADWSPLKGRRVWIAPEANDPPDKSGRRPGDIYAEEVALQAFQNGATEVEIVDTAALSRMLPDGSTREGPRGWDLADAADDRWKSDQLRTVIDNQQHLRRKLVPHERHGTEGITDEPTQSGSELPVVRVVPGELPRVIDEAESALLKSGQPIFSRAGALFGLVIDEVPASNGRMTTVARLRPMCAHSMIDCMAQAATFQRLDKRQDEWVRKDPPQKAADILLARDGKWRLPPIVGVITSPTLRPDGSLLTEPGYDPETRLFLAPDCDFSLPHISETPSREDAQAALQLLRDLISGFPFAGPVDEAVALSGLMSPTSRGAMSVAPLHAIRAYAPGSGKSHLVDVAAALATGRRCPVITPGKNEEEMEKRLGALLRDGVSLVSLDNVNGELGGDLLCQMTERPVLRVRVLGQSKAPEFECRSTVFATGNNLVVVGDMTRRTLLCTLDAGVEEPEKRPFSFDPVQRVLECRSTYVAAVLTIIRAYVAAGAPSVCGPLGSYGEWSAFVRSPLVWLGLPDPADSMATARAEDPTLSEMRELFTYWREHLGLGAPYTASQIIKLASNCDQEGAHTAPGFRELLLRLAGQGSEVSSRRLGKWLTKAKGRVVEGCRLEIQPDDHHGNRFTLVQAEVRERWGF